MDEELMKDEQVVEEQPVPSEPEQEQNGTEHKIVTEQVTTIEPETIEVEVVEIKYTIKLKDGSWVKKWNPFETTKHRSEAMIFNKDWAEGNVKRLKKFKNIAGEAIPI